jgi:hypothetical protein
LKQTIIVVGATKKNRVSSTILLQRNFSKKQKKMSAKCVDIFFAVVMFSIVVFLLFAPF